MRKIISLLLVLVLALVIVGCTKSTTQTQDNSNTQTDTAQTPLSGTATVTIKSFQFTPETITVASGTTVVWQNEDSVSHSIKSAGFNSDIIGQAQKYTFTFETPGTYDYTCSIHPAMKGRIIVE